jgi:hypothetical protein
LRLLELDADPCARYTFNFFILNFLYIYFIYKIVTYVRGTLLFFAYRIFFIRTIYIFYHIKMSKTSATVHNNFFDICYRDKMKRVPYTLAKDRDTRNVFRKFSGQHPDR